MWKGFPIPFFFLPRLNYNCYIRAVLQTPSLYDTDPIKSVQKKGATSGDRQERLTHQRVVCETPRSNAINTMLTIYIYIYIYESGSRRRLNGKRVTGKPSVNLMNKNDQRRRVQKAHRRGGGG